MMLPTTPAVQFPRWAMVLTLLGLIWNLFGAFQFFGSLNASVDSLLAQGLSPEQARISVGLPVWMHIAFGWGVTAGVLGCGLLLAHRLVAQPVLLSSLLAYLVLFVGDITEGVFAAFGTPQVVILSTVVAIAAGLSVLARRAAQRNWLK